MAEKVQDAVEKVSERVVRFAEEVSAEPEKEAEADFEEVVDAQAAPEEPSSENPKE